MSNDKAYRPTDDPTDGCGFDESLISGYLDRELTQADRQRVEVHLESCESCRAIADDLRQITEATVNTSFPIPEDLQWDERPRNGLSRILRISGLVVAAAWLLGLIALLGWQAIADEESVRLGSLLGLAPILALALIVASAAIDRFETAKTDPYRKVKK